VAGNESFQAVLVPGAGVGEFASVGVGEYPSVAASLYRDPAPVHQVVMEPAQQYPVRHIGRPAA
jgi:hypothetical protein